MYAPWYGSCLLVFFERFVTAVDPVMAAVAEKQTASKWMGFVWRVLFPCIILVSTQLGQYLASRLSKSAAACDTSLAVEAGSACSF
jgi:hypothetical protein